MKAPACAMVWHFHSTAHDRKTFSSTLYVSTPNCAEIGSWVVASATGGRIPRVTGTLNSVESRGATFRWERRFPTPGAYLKQFNSAHSKSRGKIAQWEVGSSQSMQYRAGRPG